MSKISQTERGADFAPESKFTPEDNQKPGLESESGDKEKERLLGLESQITTQSDELKLTEQMSKDTANQGIENPGLSGKTQKIRKKLGALEDQKSDWLKQNGIEKLPEGVIVPEGEDGRALKLDVSRDQAEKMSEAERRKLIDEWKRKSVKIFIKAVQSDWRSRDAINLSMVVDVIKNNTPLAIEKKAKQFLSGETDSLPNVAVIHWKTNSIFDSLTGKPNQIKELKIDFEGETQVLAGPEELSKETGEEEKLTEKKEIEPTDLKEAA